MSKTLKAAKSSKVIWIDVTPTISPHRRPPAPIWIWSYIFSGLFTQMFLTSLELNCSHRFPPEKLARLWKPRWEQTHGPLQASSIGYRGALMGQYITRLRWLWMAWHHSLPRENVLFYWPPQLRVVPCAHVIQQPPSEGKDPPHPWLIASVCFSTQA